MNRKIVNILTALLIVIVTVTLWRWMSIDPVAEFQTLEPGLDNAPEESAVSSEQVQIGEFFQAFNHSAADIPGDWPRFRGEDFDNIAQESIPLANAWPQSGPSEMWRIDLGEGHAGPAVVDGRVYVLDYREAEDADALRAFSLKTGGEIWRRWYHNPMKRNHGLSRTVPAVARNSVLTVGPKCHVMCVSADSGQFKWGIDMVQEYGAEVPLWYTGQCPLILDSLAVLAPGGSSLLIAVDLDSGHVVWETPNPDGWNMSHSSIMPMTLFGRDVLVYAAIGGIVGVQARGENAGSVLFKTPDWNENVIAPSPLHLGDGRIFMTAGYGAGSMLFQVARSGDSFSIETLLDYEPSEGLASEQQTPILYHNHLFSILPKDAGNNRNQLVCSSINNLQEFVYTSGKTTRFGLGPYLIADEKLYILSDDGTLTMAELSTRRYNELGRAKILDGHDAWGPLALVNGYLIARDSRQMVCVDLAKER